MDINERGDEGKGSRSDVVIGDTSIVQYAGSRIARIEVYGLLKGVALSKDWRKSVKVKITFLTLFNSEKITYNYTIFIFLKSDCGPIRGVTWKTSGNDSILS